MYWHSPPPAFNLWLVVVLVVCVLERDRDRKRRRREREILLIVLWALAHPFPPLITFCQFRYIKSSYQEFPSGR